MSTPATITFDFSYYLPGQGTGLGIYKLPAGQCINNNFILSVICDNLIPGNSYQITYQILNPNSNPGNRVNIFNPAVESIYASFSTQTFATLVDLDVAGDYVLQATLYDQENDVRSSAMCTLKCGDDIVPSPSPTQTPTLTPSAFSRQNRVIVELVDPGYTTINDGIIVLPSGTTEFPLVGLAKNTIIGYKYNYEFFDVPPNSVSFEKKSGEFFSGESTQNFNSKITFPNNEGKFIYLYASVTDSENNITKLSDPILFKHISTTMNDINLPSGIDLAIGAPAFRSCALRGLTNDSISDISGGKGFRIGDKLSPNGGGGYGASLTVVAGGITTDSFTAFSGGNGYNIGDYISVTGGGGVGGLIQITSGGLTNDSVNINTIGGCTGFSIGDLLTTTGGGGKDAVLEVTNTGAGGTITSINVLNPGHGYTYAPNGLVSLNSSGSCTNIVFNADNFTIPAAGGISSDSIKLQGGTGYNIGEIVDIIGGGGSGAQVKITSGSITKETIDGTLPAGSGFTVGDLLTTTGGDGSDVVIRVTEINELTGAITDWEVINGGYGFTVPPTALSVLKCSSENCSQPAISANSDNFGIPAAGSITKSSISSFINTGTGYDVGDTLLITGGNGTGATIEILSVDGSGKILDFVITSGGSGYTSIPIVLNSSGGVVTNTPAFDTSKFTKTSFAIIDAGSGYYNAPSQFSSDGDGAGLVATFNSNNFTDPSFTVINSGSGYTGAPTGLQSLTGDGQGVSASFNNDHFTIPALGGITSESITVSGGNHYNIGETLNVVGGRGSGAQIKIVSGSMTLSSITSLTGGYGYAPNDLLTTTGGGGSDVVIKILTVDSYGDILTYEVLNGGYGFTSAPTGLVTLTGNGTAATLVANSNNFAISKENGITNSSISSLIGTNTTVVVAGDIISLTGGGGTGAEILVTSVDQSGVIISYIVINSGSGYKTAPSLVDHNEIPLTTGIVFDINQFTDKPYVVVNAGSGYSSYPPSIVSSNGDGSGASINSDPNKFSQLAVNITDPGSGYLDSPISVTVLTGYGDVNNLNSKFNAENFVEIIGVLPSPTPTSSITPTPTISQPVPCNDLQSAGGQNPIYILNVVIPAVSGQNYIVVDNVPTTALQYSILRSDGLDEDTHAVSVEDYFRSIDDTAGFKKITLNNNIIENIPIETEVTLYTVDTRVIQTSFWPGTMTFYYEAYTIPDRFKVIGIPVDKTKPEVLLFDSGFRGSSPCGYATGLSGTGAGSYQIEKPDGMIYIKVVVEAPCASTAWTYLLTCPVRTYPFTSPTPTPTPTITVTKTNTLTPTPTRTPI